YSAHVRLNDWKQRNRFGRKLAPIEPWGDYGKLLETADQMKIGGLSSLSMRAIRPEYGEEGGLNVTVQPSVRIDGNAGVFFNVNHHMGKGAGDDEPLTVLLYK